MRWRNSTAVRRLLAGELGPESPRGELMVPTDEREARLQAFRPRPRGPSPVADSRGVRVGGNPGAFGVRSGRTAAGLGVAGAGRTSEGVGPGRRSPGGRPGDDVAPVALLADDLEELRRFVTDVLGDLEDDERNSWLRETLRSPCVTAEPASPRPTR